ALSLGAADYLSPLLPGASAITVALAALAVATALGVLNIRASAAVTGAFLLIELLALLFVTAVGAAHPARSLASLLAHPVPARRAPWRACSPLLWRWGRAIRWRGRGLARSPPPWSSGSSPTTATAAPCTWPRRCATYAASWCAQCSGRSPSPRSPRWRPSPR